MQDLKIHFLNTVWSDAILLERKGHFALVDTGSHFYYPMIQATLSKYNIKDLDFIFLTHFHSDHYGNVACTIQDYNVQKLYIKKYCAHESDTGSGYPTTQDYYDHEMTKFKEIIDAAHEKGTKVIYQEHLKHDIKFQGLTLHLFQTHNILNEVYNDKTSPFYQKPTFSENYNSVPIFISINHHYIFLGSDMMNSESSVAYINRAISNTIQKIYDTYHIDHIDVYKSCHHGGGGTNKEDVCNLLKANYAVITNTDKWLDVWPTRGNLKAANPHVTILQTDHNQYVFDFSKKDISYEIIPEESLFITLKKE